MLIPRILLYLHNHHSFLQKCILFSFNSSIASNKCCVFLTSFFSSPFSFCLFIVKIIIIIIINIIIICQKLGLDGSASASSNSLFKRLHKSPSSIWPIIQHYFWYSDVHSCYIVTNLIYICLISH